MKRLADLDAPERWVAHMLRYTARRDGWMSKRTGVESLFKDRQGALRVIGQEFTGAHLFLRALPDMLLRSRKGTQLTEVKALTPSCRETGNVSLELTQYLTLRIIATLDVQPWYCFGYAHAGALGGWILGVRDLHPHRADIPARVRHTYPLSLQEAIDKSVRRLGIPRREVSGTRGSDDPYILVSLSTVRAGIPIAEWLSTYGGGTFGLQERIAWEGRDEAKQTWAPLPPPAGIVGSEVAA